MPEFDYDRLVDAVRAGRLVAFVGAGVSTTYTDDAGHRWRGLPTGCEVVEQLAATRKYIDPALGFTEACFLLKNREGRSVLEEYLVELFDKPTLDASPAHMLLARLGFSGYVTPNYDQLLEKAMRAERRQFAPVVSDDDVSKFRPNQVPIIKYHGCVSRPKSLVAALDEYKPLDHRAPILEALLKTILANRTALFLGFNLGDDDFAATFEHLRATLGDYMPRSYAVTLGLPLPQRELWESRGLEMIDLDLTTFLRGLQRAAVGDAPAHPMVYNPRDDFMRLRYFESLHTIRSQPTETMVIDAFLEHLLKEFRSKSLEFDAIISEARVAADFVLSRRPHFEALRKVTADVLDRVLAAVTSKGEAEVALMGYLRKREGIASRIAKRGTEHIGKGETLLLYSQSRRVVEFLKGVPQTTQSACQLFIAECRPKSPKPMQDALAFCEALNGTSFEVTIIPDMAIGHLMGRRQVNKVILGAHTVYSPSGSPTAFVNTCGSDAICRLAEAQGIEVLIVAEKIKISQLKKPRISYEQEEKLFDPIDDDIRRLSTLDRSVKSLNIGYDLCPWRPALTLVTD